jgi:hypothetical protein
MGNETSEQQEQHRGTLADAAVQRPGVPDWGRRKATVAAIPAADVGLTRAEKSGPAAQRLSAFPSADFQRACTDQSAAQGGTPAPARKGQKACIRIPIRIKLTPENPIIFNNAHGGFCRRVFFSGP